MGGRPRSLGKHALFFLALALLCSIVAHSAASVGIGVNRGEISYEDVLQNGYAEETVLVTTDSPDPIGGGYEIEGDLAPWIRIDPPNETFAFSSSEPYALKIVVEPPQDARLQRYTGGVRVITGELARTEGGKIGTTTRAAFLIKISAGVTGTEVIKCVVGGVRIKDTEIGQPFDFVATVQNTGNVRLQPRYTVQVWDQNYSRLVLNTTVTAPRQILPTTMAEFTWHIRHDLQPGQYWARIDVPECHGASDLTFDILDRGGIADKGELVRIDVQPRAKTGEIVPAYAIFRNIGARTVSAKFTGTVTDQEGTRIFKVIDTDAQNVLPGETAKLETFFNPTASGRYIIAGRVLYNNKLTYQKSAILNVEGPGMVPALEWSWFILIAVVIVILVLLILIARRRRQSRGRRTIFRR
jgi:hypothetical protein